MVSEGVQRAEEIVRSSAGDRYLSKSPRKLQADTFSCGAQGALAVARMLRRLGTDDEGTTDAALRRLFRRYGFRGRPVTEGARSDLDRAIDDGSPVIVSVDRRSPHCAIVYGIGPGRVYIADPSVKRSVSGNPELDRLSPPMGWRRARRGADDAKPRASTQARRRKRRDVLTGPAGVGLRASARRRRRTRWGPAKILPRPARLDWSGLHGAVGDLDGRSRRYGRKQGKQRVVAHLG
jgi:predicted double-glycine peptidase